MKAPANEKLIREAGIGQAMMHVYAKHYASVFDLDFATVLDFARDGMQQALVGYRPELGAFSTYARRRIRGEIIDRCTAMGRDSIRYSDAKPMRWRINTDYLAKPSKTPEDLCISKEIALKVRRAIATLSPELRETVEHAYVGGQSFREIAREVGVHHSTIARRCKQAKEELRLRLSALATVV